MSFLRFSRRFALVLLVLVHCSATRVDFIDDAYISFRYAWNLAHGQGLVFSPGDSVEGFSNPTWVLLSAAALKASLPLEATVRILSVSCLAAAVVLVDVLLSALGASARQAFGAAAALALSTAWILPALNGLEGPLFSLLLVVSTGVCLSGEERSRVTSVASGLAGTLLAATRPEGALIYLFQLGVRYLLLRRQSDRPPAGRRALSLALTIFLAGLASLSAWRLALFGSVIPTSVLAKLGSPLHPLARFSLSPHGDGLRYILGFVASCWPFWLFVGLCISSEVSRRRAAAKEGLDEVVVAGLAVLAPAFFIVMTNNGDWMPDYRLLAPYIAPLSLAVGGLGALASRSRLSWALFATGLLSIAPARLTLPSIEPLVSSRPSAFRLKMCGLGQETGEALRNTRAPVVAVEVLGVFGYCAPDLRIRDLNGLTDPVIASNEPSSGTFGRKTSARTLEAMRPDIVMYSDLNYLRILLAESPWFGREYLALTCDRLFGEPLFIYYFVRRDSLIAERAASRLCPLASDRRAPDEAFRLAACRLPAWPYAFPRECAAGGPGT